jgi:hypothetical protein
MDADYEEFQVFPVRSFFSTPRFYSCPVFALIRLPTGLSPLIYMFPLIKAVIVVLSVTRTNFLQTRLGGGRNLQLQWTAPDAGSALT